MLPLRVEPTVPDRAVTAFHMDEEGQWVAELACGHTIHVRHDPPWQKRPWVTTAEGRAAFVGTAVPCSQCLKSADETRSSGTS